MNVSLRVKRIIAKHGTNSLYQIASDLEVTVVSAKLPYGFWQRILHCKYIFVNNDLPEDVQRFVVAHELGHILLHPGYAYYYMENRTYYADTTPEDQANEFASLLLDAPLPVVKGDLWVKT